MEKLLEEELVRSNSIRENLEFANMMSEEVRERRTISKTIWDTPEREDEESPATNGDMGVNHTQNTDL